ncbi:MAG: glycosyltransferase [Phascolarctobacterium sp.]|uniref:glycosyltransferase n=1 Tax=Phascolarctobacterium sp. TaxID=2049039 RepID=UPI0026DD137D|nr:glycosyltransferase [Phascolarctobacterium sp.]MDO4921684.1 glycosyltransferase [Phascolarctobacterium sp.]
MQFSVLLSVYKNEKPEYLRLALQSIAAQTLQPDEIVIVKDGGLTQALDAVIDDFAAKQQNVRVLPFAQNRGLGLALRDGVEACNYEYIARMDTDDIALPDRFARQMAYLEQHQDIALLGSWITEFSQDADKPDTITKLPCTHEAILSYAKKRNPFRHMTVVFKKSAVITSGNYRDFLWFEDYDLWVRILQQGYKVANMPEVLVNVRAGEEMFARRGGWRYLKQEVRFQRALYERGFIGLENYANNVFVRIAIRLVPNKVRIFVYKKILRRTVR